MAGADDRKLSGFTVAVASDRRRHPLALMLESIGAKTVSLQAFRSFSQPDDGTVRAATMACLEQPVHEVVISSGFGLRAWFTAARRWGLSGELVARLAQARLLARDAATADSLRAFGLTVIWSTAGATTEELLRYLLAQPLAGRRIVVQTQDPTLHDVCALMRERGADAIEVPTFTLAGPIRSDFLRRLTDLVLRRQVDAVAFLGGAGAEHLLRHATAEGTVNELLNTLRENVLCAALSPSSCRAFAGLGISPLTGSAPFVEELAEAILHALPLAALRITAAGRELEIRGHAAILDGRLFPIQPGPLAVLRVLAEHHGRLVSPADLRTSIPGWSGIDDHAVEQTVSRLRQAIDDPFLVQTVMRRGYRLTL